jgi:hypothetical protein
MAPWAQGPSEQPVWFVWCRRLGFSAADAWKVASPRHMGIMHSHNEESFSSPRPAGSFA